MIKKRGKNFAVMRYALTIIGILMVAILIEFLGFQGKQLFIPENERGTIEITYGPPQLESQKGSDGIVTTKIYQIPINQSYTNKIAVYLNGPSGYSKYTMQYKKKDDEAFSIEKLSYCNMASGRDYIKIGEQIDTIILKIEEDTNLEKVVLDNTIRLNGRRIVWMFCIGLAAYLLYMFNGLIGKKLEIGFLVVGLTAGMAWTIALPINTSLTWDDQIHYRNTYRISYMSNEFLATQAEQDLSSLKWSEFRQPSYFHVVDTLEDELELIRLLDERYLLTQENTTYYTAGLTGIGYVTQAFGIGIGRVLGLPFHLQFMLGKLGNILFYIGISYWAIKQAVRYKAILCAIALMPTAFQIACGYSYDPTVNACLMLGCSIFITEMMTPTKRLQWKNAAIMLIAFSVGSFPKAIYIPLILLLLLLPNQKFSDKRSRICFNAGIIVIFVVLMSSFIVPTVLSSPSAGDIRGGQDVSLTNQLSFVLHHPITYAKVFFKALFSRSYGLLEDAIYSIPYMETFVTDSALSSLIPAFRTISLISLLYIGFTDCKKGTDTTELRNKIRCWIFVAIVTVIGLIWTSMYLAFTPVAAGGINGVQGRYFIPLFFLVAVLLNPRKSESKADPTMYNLMVLGCNALVLFGIVGVYLIGSVWI